MSFTAARDGFATRTEKQFHRLPAGVFLNGERKVGMNYYERHIGDYLKDTAHLSLLEHGIYSRLLDVYYIRESPIPNDHVARLIGARTKEEKKSLASVLSEFFLLIDQSWKQGRCDLEISRFQKKAEHNRTVGKLGGRPRKTITQVVLKQEPTNNPSGFKTEPTNNPPQSPVTSNQIPSVDKSTDGKPSVKPPKDKSKTELWSAAVSLLSGQGMPEPQARQFFGKLSKDYKSSGEDIVLEAVRGAVSEQPADARAYLKATCQRLSGERKRDGSRDWTAEAV